MGHVRLKTRSPGEILGKFCLHSRGQICDPILMKPDQNVLAMCKPSLNMGHVGLTSRSPGQILVYTLDAAFVAGFL